MAMVFASDGVSPSRTISRRDRWVIVQKRNMIHVAESNALMVLTMRATCVGSFAKCEKRLAVSMKNGAPGGCPISSL